MLIAAAQLGALVYPPFKVLTFSVPEDCAEACQSVESIHCQSFNYDYGPAGTCELLQAVHGQDAKVHQVILHVYYLLFP